MQEKPWIFVIVSFVLCLIAGIFFLVRQDWPYSQSLDHDLFTGKVRFQACPPQSNSPNCYTPTAAPPTPVPPSPSPIPPDPTVPPVISEEEPEHRNRHATLTAEAARYLAVPTSTFTHVPVTASVVNTSIVTENLAIPTQPSLIVGNPPSPALESDSAGYPFILVAVVILLGIGVIVFLIK